MMVAASFRMFFEAAAPAVKIFLAFPGTFGISFVRLFPAAGNKEAVE